MGLDLNRQTWAVHDHASGREKRAAARYVASRSADATEAAQLLAMLGLLPAHHPAVMRPTDHGITGYRLGCRCKRCRKANRYRLQRQRTQHHHPGGPVNSPILETIALVPAHPLPAAASTVPRLYRVAGLDISLTGTGISTLGGTTRVPTTGRRRDTLLQRNARLAHITARVLVEVGDVDLACVEGPVSYATPGGSTWDRGGLWWRIVAALLDRDIPVAVISPTARAKYATGSGAARKAAVIDAAQKRYGAILPTDDEADALILRAMGLHWLGQPLAEVPDGHRAALAGVQWPDREAVTAP